MPTKYAPSLNAYSRKGGPKSAILSIQMPQKIVHILDLPCTHQDSRVLLHELFEALLHTSPVLRRLEILHLRSITLLGK